MIPRCWNCPDQPPLVLAVRERDVTWDGREIVVFVWTCERCGHGTIRREPPQAALPLED